MKTILAFIFTLTLTSLATADEIRVLSLLQRDLGETLKVHSEKEIWYCPDNTCEMYKANKPHPDFPAFVYMHLFHQSEYIYLKESIGGFKAFRETAVEEPIIRTDLSTCCPSNSRATDCIISSMKKELGIKLCFGRYDEGSFCYGCKEKENICQAL